MTVNPKKDNVDFANVLKRLKLALTPEKSLLTAANMRF
ncbi:MAG: hypothetical protein ACI8SE_001818 [Bacteroidia bacterium]|jgi:hypothetical protein